MMAKAKEVSSKTLITSLLDKAWQKAKGKPRSDRGTKADVEARELRRIAEKIGRSTKQIRDIKEGKRPGKNLAVPLKAMKGGRKPAPPPKDPIKAKARRKPEPKAPPPKPARPRKIKAIVSGNIGPYNDDAYLRPRTIRPVLSGAVASRFLDALDAGDQDMAAAIAAFAYFDPLPGYVSLEEIDYEVMED